MTIFGIKDYTNQVSLPLNHTSIIILEEGQLGDGINEGLFNNEDLQQDKAWKVWTRKEVKLFSL
jgi:hypothetical protein